MAIERPIGRLRLDADGHLERAAVRGALDGNE
jgi:hypothetical protein